MLTSHAAREIVLGRLVAIVKSSVNVSLARGLSEVAAETAGGKIVTIWVCMVRVVISTLCVVLKHVFREYFLVPSRARSGDNRIFGELSSDSSLPASTPLSLPA